MRKWFGLLLCLMVIIPLTGCGGSGSLDRTEKQLTGFTEDAPEPEPEAETAPGPAAALEPEAASGVAPASAPAPVGEAEASNGSTEGIDVDLTALSSTMVYAEVYQMMVSPESYIGKSVKMDGAFASYHDEASDRTYFACVVADATACCSQGIEFVLTEDYTYPDDYPEEGGEICVVGVFDTYQEGGYTYCTLRNARIV